MKFIRKSLIFVLSVGVPSLLILGLFFTARSVANYAATAGSGLTFQSFDNAGIKSPGFVGVGSDGVENIGQVSVSPWVSGNGTVISILKNIANGIAGAIPSCGSLPACPTIGGTFPVSNSIGGATPYSLLVSTASTNSTNIKGSAGTLYELTVIQTTTTLGDLRIYDTSSAPTCSSSTNMKKNIPIQSNAVSPGITISFPTGLLFANGISFCFTGAVADNDNTNWGGTASGVSITASYN